MKSLPHQQRSTILFWERIGFRIALGILLPLGMSVYALVSLAGFYEYATGTFDAYTERKENIERTWTSVRLSELDYRVRLAETKYLAERFINGDRKSQRQKINAALIEVEKGVGQVSRLSGDFNRPDSRRLYNSIFSTLRYLRDYFASLDQENSLQDSRSVEEFRQRFFALSSDLEQSLRRLKARFELYEMRDVEALQVEYRRIRNETMTNTIIVFLLGLVICTIVTVTITNPINKVMSRLRDIALGEGDLTKRIQTRTIGEMRIVAMLMNEFLDTIHGIVSTIRNATETIKESVSQVQKQTQSTTASAIEINQNMLEQSNSLEDCSVSLSRIDELLQSTSESTRQAASLSRLTMDRALKGGASVQETVGAMEKIEESAKKVEYLVSTINGIATQTNLLAINAAIEASKAGEHGKGFAVVAEEVRKLAERSRSLTVEVTDLIVEVNGRVKTGSNLARGAGVALDGIIKDVEAVASLIQRIAAASNKQTESSSRLLASIQNVNEAVRQNLSSMLHVSEGTEVAQSEVEKLYMMMTQLNQIVHQFKLIELMDAFDSAPGTTTNIRRLPSVEEVAARNAYEDQELSAELRSTYLPQDPPYQNTNQHSETFNQEPLVEATEFSDDPKIEFIESSAMPPDPVDDLGFEVREEAKPSEFAKEIVAAIDENSAAPARTEDEFEIDPEDTSVGIKRPSNHTNETTSAKPLPSIPEAALRDVAVAGESEEDDEDGNGFYSADELSKEIVVPPKTNTPREDVA